MPSPSERYANNVTPPFGAWKIPRQGWPYRLTVVSGHANRILPCFLAALTAFLTVTMFMTSCTPAPDMDTAVLVKLSTIHRTSLDHFLLYGRSCQLVSPRM